MRVSRVSMLLAWCCRGTTSQILSADDLDHVSLLQTQVHRRNTKDGSDEPNLNILQDQLNKLQHKVATESHVHEAKERKSMMMVDLQSTTPDKEIEAHKAKANGSKKKEKKPTKLNKFAKASLAKADKAKEMERSAMASIMDDEAGELEDNESHVLSAGALDRLEQVAERVAQSKDQDDGWQEFELDERRDDERHNQHKSKTGQDKHNRRSKKDEDKDQQEKDDELEEGSVDDAVDPEAELVKLAHQRAKREEAKAQLAEGAAKDAWLELEKFQAQRNVDSFPTGAPTSAPQASLNEKSVQRQKNWRGR